MVALNEQFHHNGTLSRLLGTGYRFPRDGESVEVFSDHGPRATDQKTGSSDDLFIDHCSLIFERSAGANDLIYCGYRFDPETELYYVRNRTYSPVLGRWLQRDPIGYAGGINLYEYVGGRAVAAADPEGTLWGVVAYLCGHLADQAAKALQDALKAAGKAADDRRKIGACPPPHGLKLMRLELEQAAEVAKSAEDAAKAGALFAAMGALGCQGAPAWPPIIPGIPPPEWWPEGVPFPRLVPE